MRRSVAMAAMMAALIGGAVGVWAQQPAVQPKPEPPKLAQPKAGTSAKAEKAQVKKRTAAGPSKAGTSAVEAKVIFGAMSSAAPMAARAIGFYSRGCLAGAQPLAIDGPNWQAMRLSRNRNWGHPDLIALIERLARDAKAGDGWPGLLVGDISQPRGGPMLTGHASHQIGLDADIWLTPMPKKRLSYDEREQLAATSMLGADGVLADPAVFTPNHARLILRAASYPSVERVLVHPGIKKALCQRPGTDPIALGKIRPFWGHHYHMHIRIGCPKDSSGCAPQPPVPVDNGCGKEVDDWIALMRRPEKPVDPAAPKAPPKPGLTLEQLPAECRMVIEAGAPASAAGSRAKANNATAGHK